MLSTCWHDDDDDDDDGDDGDGDDNDDDDDYAVVVVEWSSGVAGGLSSKSADGAWRGCRRKLLFECDLLLSHNVVVRFDYVGL